MQAFALPAKGSPPVIVSSCSLNVYPRLSAKSFVFSLIIRLCSDARFLEVSVQSSPGCFSNVALNPECVGLRFWHGLTSHLGFRYWMFFAFAL